ncbi:Sec1-like protein [Paraphysoderma sedebokerense]|nr:Sec1-like protein [Paraphysoderma sedebokerense]
MTKTQNISPYRPSILKDLAKKEFLDILDSVRGQKGLVLDPTLSAPISLITEFSLIKEHGVSKIYHLQPGPLPTDCTALVYLCRPNVAFMDWIVEHIKSHAQKSMKLEYAIFFVPRRTLLCERALEEKGVYNDVTIGEYHLDFLSLEPDLLSLELPSSFRELFLEEDFGSLPLMVNAIGKIQSLFGQIPRILGKGNRARILTDLLLRKIPSSSSESLPAVPSEFEAMIILDRSTDLLTPLLTQLTYSGQLDETFGIKNSHIDVDASLLSGSSGSGGTNVPAARKRKVPLTSADPLYADLCDLNFSVVGPTLSQVARSLKEDYDERHQAETVTQLRDFVGKLPVLQVEHQSLRIHTALTSEITVKMDNDFHQSLEIQQSALSNLSLDQHFEYIEELIDRQYPVEQVLRILCITSIAYGGIKPKILDHLKREIINTYGIQHLTTLHHLSLLSLLTPTASSSSNTTLTTHPRIPPLSYTPLRKSLNLVVDNINEKEPNDPGYVFSGYAPITVRLIENLVCGVGGVQAVINGTGNVLLSRKFSKRGIPGAGGTGSGLNGWKGLEDVARCIPGKTFDEFIKNENTTAGSSVFRKLNPRTTSNTILLLFLGGITYAEISAIRFLSTQLQKLGIEKKFVILTDGMMNGNGLINSLTGLGNGVTVVGEANP